MAENLQMVNNRDEDERAKLRSRRKFQTDYESDMATSWDNGKAVGKAEGRAEGKAEGKIEVALNLTKLHFSIDQISLITGLPRKDIESLLLKN